MSGFASGGIAAGPVRDGDGALALLSGCDYVLPRRVAGRIASKEEFMNPTVGRIVHYVSHGTPVRPDGSQAYASECRAAIVTEVSREHSSSDGALMPRVGLCVLNPAGQFFNLDVRYGEYGENSEDRHPGGTWHWPERAE